MLAQLTALGESSDCVVNCKVLSAGSACWWHSSVSLGLWPLTAALQSNPLPLELFMALPLQLCQCHFRMTQSPVQGLEWQQMEGCRGCAWGPGVLGVSVGGIPGTLGGVSGYRRWTFPCVWLLRPSMSSVCSTNPSWLAAAPLAHAVLSLGEGTRPSLQSSTRKQQQHCRGTGSSLASAVPLGGKSSLQDSLVSTAAGTLHR